jgi:hypothetical protein
MVITGDSPWAVLFVRLVTCRRYMCILALVTITFWMIMSVWDPTDFDDNHDVSVCLTVLLNPMMQIRDTLVNALDQSLVLTPSTCHLDFDRSELKLPMPRTWKQCADSR